MKKTSTKKENAYTLSVAMNGKIYTSNGATLEECFDGLGVTYREVKTKGEISVLKGDKKAVRLIQLPKLRRYFVSKLLKVGLIRDLEKLLA